MSVHFLKGSDAALLGAALGELVHRLLGDADRSMAVSDFDGDEYELGSVVDAALTPPFLTDLRVVVAREIGRFDTEAVAPLVRYLADPMPSTELVLTSSGGRLPKALTDAFKAGGAQTQDTDPGTGKARQGWLDEHLAGAAVSLDDGARRAVAERLGEDLGRLAGVLEVLESAYGTHRRLHADDVLPYLGEAGSVPPWELTDAIDRGETVLAMTRLRRMLRAGGRHPLQLMAILHGHYQRMLQLDGTDARDEKAAAEVLGIKGSTFPARKALDQTQRLGHEGIARAVSLLAEADLDLRGRRALPEELVMEVLVGRLSRLAPATRSSTRGPARR